MQFRRSSRVIEWYAQANGLAVSLLLSSSPFYSLGTQVGYAPVCRVAFTYAAPMPIKSHRRAGLAKTQLRIGTKMAPRSWSERPPPTSARVPFWILVPACESSSPPFEQGLRKPRLSFLKSSPSNTSQQRRAFTRFFFTMWIHPRSSAGALLVLIPSCCCCRRKPASIQIDGASQWGAQPRHAIFNALSKNDFNCSSFRLNEPSRRWQKKTALHQQARLRASSAVCGGQGTECPEIVLAGSKITKAYRNPSGSPGQIPARTRATRHLRFIARSCPPQRSTSCPAKTFSASTVRRRSGLTSQCLRHMLHSTPPAANHDASTGHAEIHTVAFAEVPSGRCTHDLCTKILQFFRLTLLFRAGKTRFASLSFVVPTNKRTAFVPSRLRNCCPYFGYCLRRWFYICFFRFFQQH